MKKKLTAILLLICLALTPVATVYAEPTNNTEQTYGESDDTGDGVSSENGVSGSTTDSTNGITDGTTSGNDTTTEGTTGGNDTTATEGTTSSDDATATDGTTGSNDTTATEGTTGDGTPATGKKKDILDEYGDLTAFAASDPPSIASVGGIVMDVDSGAVLYEKNINKRLYPASITKIMTTLVALENSSMDEVVTFSQNAVDLIQNQGASNIEIVPGEKLTMEESLYAIMLMSANEVCNGVAEHVAGDIKTFVKMMNKRAKELGCTGTHFNNTNGLWEKNHYTTTHDMALIARAAYKNEKFAEITGTKWYKLPKTNKRKAGYTLHNHHGMLLPLNYPQYEYKYCVGGKTGYTSQCLYTLVTYAKKKDMTILSVIMRNPNPPYLDDNQYSDTTKLLNYGLNNYHRVMITDEEVSDVNTERLFTQFNAFFNTETSSLYVDENAGILLPKGKTLDDVEKTVEYYSTDVFDENGNRAIGRIHYTYHDTEVGGTYIYYKNRGTPTLNDSINMKQWFDEAVEKATETPFPWLAVIVVVVIVILLVAGFIIFLPVLRTILENRNRAKHYKRNKKSGGMSRSMGSVPMKKYKPHKRHKRRR
ncbi:MAG: D-alanyl-D-alanine carboxypeptidase [Eubacterium sp.]|nr:D-alanyl-D-alanine carboxypeptidase [Eubacterium sp.]